MLLFVVGIVVAPLALISRVEHSHPLALDGQQLAHHHFHGGIRLDKGRSQHHHGHTHHHHDHSHHHHAKTESTDVDDELGSSRATTKSEISPGSRHQHFNLFGLSFLIHFDGRASDATAIEESRSLILVYSLRESSTSALRCHPLMSPSIRLISGSPFFPTNLWTTVAKPIDRRRRLRNRLSADLLVSSWVEIARFLRAPMRRGVSAFPLEDSSGGQSSPWSTTECLPESRGQRPISFHLRSNGLR